MTVAKCRQWRTASCVVLSSADGKRCPVPVCWYIRRGFARYSVRETYNSADVLRRRSATAWQTRQDQRRLSTARSTCYSSRLLVWSVFSRC